MWWGIYHGGAKEGARLFAAGRPIVELPRIGLEWTARGGNGEEIETNTGPKVSCVKGPLSKPAGQAHHHSRGDPQFALSGEGVWDKRWKGGEVRVDWAWLRDGPG